MRMLFSGPNIGPVSNARLIVKKLPLIKQLAGPNGTSPVWRQCMICKKAQFYSDKPEGEWFSKIQFAGEKINLDEFNQRLRALMPSMAEKSDAFPATSHGLCGPCEDLFAEQIKEKL